MSLKERLSEKLSPAFKLSLKRLYVGAVETAVRVGARVAPLARRVRRSAESHGLDWERAWDAPGGRRAPGAEPTGAADFLFLLDALEGRLPAPDPSRGVRASVVVYAFNKVEETFRCLGSLLPALDFSDAEIVVVDDASTDETGRVLARFGRYVRVLTNERRLGRAREAPRLPQTGRGRLAGLARKSARHGRRRRARRRGRLAARRAGRADSGGRRNRLEVGRGLPLRPGPVAGRPPLQLRARG
jgi:hypothetical protein